MKLTFLKWRTQSALRKNNSLRASTPYKKSNSVGIIFSVEDRQKHDDIKEFVKHLEQDGKQVKVLEFLPKKKENYEFLFDFFTVQDLTFWGKIENSHAGNFSELPFDYLFYVDNEHNPLVLDLLARSKAHCRVGKRQEGNEAYFEFMIDHNGTVKGLIENMYKYTKQLK
ncbi:MAG: hypothetical protein K2U26_13595 [Cyclobacteriaceae bacterium]|nr:hypothetical protein [Cyclobacteriaceae bacterium]